MISQNFPFFQPPQPAPMMYPFPFDFFAPSPYAFGVQDAMYQSQLYKRENPYAGYDVRLPANNSQKKLKTQFGASQAPTSQMAQKKAVSVQKVINLEEDGDDEDLIIVDDDHSNSLCVKDAVFQQMANRAAPIFEECAKQKSESGYFKNQYPNHQFLLNPSGANFNSRSNNGFLAQSQSIKPRSEPLVISVDDDDEQCDSNMSFDSFAKSNLAVSICISNNDYVFSNHGPATPKKVEPQDVKPQLIEKGGFRNQIKIKNINISYFQPCSQFDKDASTTIPESFNTPSESLSLADNQGAINFEDSETQSEFFPTDETPTASIPVFRLNKTERTRTRKAPRLVWDPKDLERGVLEQYYSDLTKVTRKEITNEEVALNSLKMNGMDIPKTLEVVKHNRAIFRDLFTVKPHLNTIKK